MPRSGSPPHPSGRDYRRSYLCCSHFWHRPAVYFFDRSIRAMSGSDIIGIYVARVIEVDELFQALDIAVVEELFLEIADILAVHDRAWSLGRGTLWRCHRHIARRRHLELAVNSRR